MILTLLCALVLTPPRFDAEGVPLPAEAVARVGSARWRNQGRLSQILPAADGRFVFTATDTDEILVWQADDGRLAHRYDLPRVGTRAELLRRGEGSRALQLAADGRVLVLDRHWDHGSVRTVDPLSGRVLAAAAFTIPRLRQARVTGDGRWLAAHTSDVTANHYRPKTQFLHVRDLTTNAVVHEVPVVGNVYGFAFSPDDKVLAVADDESLRFLDPATGKAVRAVATGYWKRVSHFAFRPDSAAVAAWVRMKDAPARDRLEVWDLAGGVLATAALELDSDHGLAETLFRPDGGQVAVNIGAEPTWHLIDARTGKETAALKLPDRSTRVAAAFAADGRRLLASAVGYLPGNGGWNTYYGDYLLPFDLTATPPAARPVPRPYPFHGTFTAGGDYVGVHEVALLRWHAGRTGETTLPVGLDPTRPFALAAAGDRLAVVPPTDKTPGAVAVVDLATGRRTAFDAGPRGAFELQFTPDGRTLLTGLRDGPAWDLATGRKVGNPWTTDPQVDYWQYHLHAGRWVTTTDPIPFFTERKPPKPTIPLGVYDRENWHGWKDPAWTLRPDGHARVSLVSADGRRAVVNLWGADQSVELWEAAGRRWAAATAAHPQAFSPDGRTIAAVRGGDVMLLEAATGGVRHRFVGHRGSATVAPVGAFSPDGRLLAASSLDAPVYLWDVRGELQKPADPPDLSAAWDELGSPDAAVAFRAVRRLAWFPDRGVPLLRAKLPPVPAPDGEQIAAWVAALDAPAFADREAALKGLKALGDLAVPNLEAVLTATASAEVRVRIEKLLTAATTRVWTADDVRIVRAVEAVEWMATPAAADLLRAWAAGAAGARLTREAKAGVGRRK